MQFLTGLLLVFAFLAVIFVTITLIIYFRQESFFFYPTKLSPNYPFSQFPSHEELFYDTPNQGRINALLFKSPQPSKGLVLYAHGNSRSLDDWAWVQSDFTSLGYDTLIFDYRTFGKSTGRLSESNFYSDIRHIFKAMSDLYTQEKIVLYGRSIGCSFATQMATEFKAKCLILETPFSSMLSLITASTPYIPVKQILKYKFNNKRKMRHLKCPVHLLHGTADELIPSKHSEKLFKTNKNPESTLTIIKDATHNNLSQFEAYHTALKKILG